MSLNDGGGRPPRSESLHTCTETGKHMFSENKDKVRFMTAIPCEPDMMCVVPACMCSS